MSESRPPAPVQAPWQPILDGALRERALTAVGGVDADLRTLADEEHGPDGSLASGSAGLAVTYAYFAQSCEDKDGTRAAEDRQIAAAFLRQAMRAAASVRMGPEFYSGLSGIGWAVEHLRGRLLDPDADPAASVAGALQTALGRTSWNRGFDLVYGLAGFGIYALERLPHSGAHECLERVVHHLSETAHRDGEHVTWLSDPAILPEWQRELSPDGHYNLGVAHGVPAVVALLAGCRAAGVAADRVDPMLTGSVAWLLAQERTGWNGAGFGYWVIPGGDDGPSRSAWCYGDPGIAAALLAAARAAERADWDQAAVSIAVRAAARPPEQAGVKDAGVCHGAAGLAHIFNRIFQATGDPRLREAARAWFERALDLRRPGRFGGFHAFHADESGESRWEEDAGILTGAAGVALALLAAAGDVEPEWDRMLCLSLRPPAPTST